jgi:hypothetical protein
MTYKKRLTYLLSLIAVLVLAYIGSFVFSHDRSNARSASYVWLDSRSAGRISKIVINDEYELVKRNNEWFVNYNNNEYPVRGVRVDDFLRILTTRAAWPVRSSSAAHFGLDEGANRVTIYGEYSVLLDLLLGDDDLMGREMYFRKVGLNEVRSGDRSIRGYVTGSVTSWYNLRLIPESENGGIGAASVQRLTVYNEGTTQVFTRSNRRWDVSGITVENPDMNSIESYINFIINAEGEDFIDPAEVPYIDLDYSRIDLELGDGRIITIRMSGPNLVNKRFAQVSGSRFIYQIPLWVTVRLFRDAFSFEMQ